jgi:membrane associated rhomboid family serine protease
MQLHLTDTIKKLLIAYVGCFLVQQLMDQVLNGAILSTFGLIPAKALGSMFVWQFVTYSFFHADVTHLVLNGLVLAFMGSEVERAWGRRRFLFYYLLCIIAAGVLYVLFQFTFGASAAAGGAGMYAPLMGASGGIYGLLIAYGIMYSERTLLFMMMFPMKAKYFIWILAGVELLTAITSKQNILSSVAHMGGMGAGFILMKWPSVLRGSKNKNTANRKPSIAAKKRSSHLKIVRDEDEGSDDKTWH